MVLSLLVFFAVLAVASESGESPREYVVGRVVVDDDTAIAYRWYSGQRPPVVLIPGSWSSAAQWDFFLEQFERSREVIVVEMRGHGESWPPPANGSIEQFGRDAHAALPVVRPQEVAAEFELFVQRVEFRETRD